MSNEVFYPYRTAGEVVELVVDPKDPDLSVTSDGVIPAWDLDVPELVLDVTIVVPDSLPAHVLNTEETGEIADVRLVIRSIQGRHRSLVDLGDGAGVRTKEVRLRLDDYAGEVRLQAQFVRLSHGEGRSRGFATEKGSSLAWSAPVRILLEEPLPPGGNFLQVFWRKFSEGDDWMQLNRDHLFLLTPTHDPFPKLFLNEEFTPNIRTVLDSRGTNGPKARTRDAAFGLIAHQVWSSLLTTSFDVLRDTAESLREDEASDGPTNSPLDELQHEWMRRVIKDWAPRLFPNPQQGDPVDSLVGAILGTGTDELLLRRLPNAIQAAVPSTRGITGLIREVVER